MYGLYLNSHILDYQRMFPSGQVVRIPEDGVSSFPEDVLNTREYGIGPLILWDSEHPLGNGTRYPLGFGPHILWALGNIIWESGIWESVNLWSTSKCIPYIHTAAIKHDYQLTYLPVLRGRARGVLAAAVILFLS